jgi:hypothetical protein
MATKMTKSKTETTTNTWTGTNKLPFGVAVLSLFEFVNVSAFVLTGLFVTNKPIIHPNVFQWSGVCVGSTWIWYQSKDFHGFPFLIHLLLASISIFILSLTIHRVQPLTANQVYHGQVTLGYGVIRNVTDTSYTTWEGWFDWYKACLWIAVITESLVVLGKIVVFFAEETEEENLVSRWSCLKFSTVMDPLHSYEEEIKKAFHRHKHSGSKKQPNKNDDSDSDDEGFSTGCFNTRDFAEFVLIDLLVFLMFLIYLDCFTVVRSVVEFIPYWTDGESTGYILGVGVSGLLGTCLGHEAQPLEEEDEEKLLKKKNKQNKKRRAVEHVHLMVAIVIFTLGACVSLVGIVFDCRLPQEHQIVCPSNVYYVRFATNHLFRTFKYEVHRYGLNVMFGRMSIANHALKITISSVAVFTLLPLALYFFQDRYNHSVDDGARKKSSSRKSRKS